MTAQQDFEIWATKRALDLSTVPDAWGRPSYQHPHIQSLWDGWEAAHLAAGEAREVAVPAEVTRVRSAAMRLASRTGQQFVIDPERERQFAAQCAASPTPAATVPPAGAMDAWTVVPNEPSAGMLYALYGAYLSPEANETRVGAYKNALRIAARDFALGGTANG